MGSDLVEIFCRQCGRSTGMYPNVGFRTVSQCVQCQMGDGFDPTVLGLPDESTPLRDVGTTIEDLRKGKREIPTVNVIASGEPQRETIKKEKRRTWMKKKSTNTP